MSVVWGSPEYVTLLQLADKYLRPPDSTTPDPVTGVCSFTFVPPLTPAEVQIGQDLDAMANLGLQAITLAEFQARKADVASLKQYMALATPTAAQTQAAFKALVRVVGSMLRVDLGT